MDPRRRSRPWGGECGGCDYRAACFEALNGKVGAVKSEAVRVKDSTWRREKLNPATGMAGTHRSVTLVLHSGGLDSSVCLLLARRRSRRVISLGFDYGQRSRVELVYAARLCRSRGIPRRVVRLRWDKPQRDIPKSRSIAEIRSQGVSPAFLPGRNAIFLTIACAEAAAVGAKEVWIGTNSIDFSGYPDCRPEFIRACRMMMRTAIPGGARIVAPLQFHSKHRIGALARGLGLQRSDVWSCYRPRFGSRQPQPCGICDGCALSELAWSVPQRER